MEPVLGRSCRSALGTEIATGVDLGGIFYKTFLTELRSLPSSYNIFR